MSRILNGAKDIFFFGARILFWFRYGFDQNITWQRKLQFYNSKLSVDEGSRLTMGKDVTIMNCRIAISENSNVNIYDRSVLKNVNIFVNQNSTVILEDGVILTFSKEKRGSVDVNSGHLHIDRFANLACNVSMRFNARLTIGMYTGIGYNSEIVCDQDIEIGKYGLISSDVDIYDTNSHSVNFEKRRQRIEAGYPTGCSEIERPDTAPVKIGDDVWIGKKSVVLKGSTIGNRSIVGMGSKVTAGIYPDESIIVNEKSRVLQLKS